MGKEQSDALLEEARKKIEELRDVNAGLERVLRGANLRITELTLDMDATKIELSAIHEELSNLRLEHQERVARG